MAVYKHPCMYCEKYIPGDSNVCPYCGSQDPFTRRCPRCRNPVEKEWGMCSSCGLELYAPCPACGKITFHAAVCEHCGISLLVTCPNRRCSTRQLPVVQKCIKCGKPLR